MKALTILISLLSIFFFSQNSIAEEKHIIVKPDEFVWADGPKSLPAGVKSVLLEGDPSKKGPFTLRLQFPPDYIIPPHWHTQIEHVTVLEGKLHLGMGDKLNKEQATELQSGSYAVLPKKHKHFAFTSDSSAIVQLHGVGPWDIIYVNKADDPRKK
jgi:quercetin dioxygenase-like cupin family protein